MKSFASIDYFRLSLLDNGINPGWLTLLNYLLVRMSCRWLMRRIAADIADICADTSGIIYMPNSNRAACKELTSLTNNQKRVAY